MRYLLTVLIFFFVSMVTLTAQNKDSVQGDFEALQALFNSTQGDDLPKLASVNDLPDVKNATYPFMYLINSEIYWLKFSKEQDRVEWRNAGSPWSDATGWNNMTPSTMGDAVGVTVDGSGRVIEVDMQKITTVDVPGKGLLTTGNNLVGELPAELGNLKKCLRFNVKQNFLYGQLPAEIGSIINLKRLSLGGSHWEIDVDDNKWVEATHRHYNTNNGSDPFSYTVSGKDVTETNRFRSELPSQWGSLIKVELIELNWQFIQGTLPDSWGNMTALKGMFLDKLFTAQINPLYSSIPDSWGNMTAVRYFKMGNYDLDPKLFGSLPAGMTRWDNLINLNLIQNDLSGEFPPFENVTNLLYFSIGRNNFTGEFPWDSIFNGNNAFINKFYISDNQFTGTIPESVPVAEFPSSNSNKYRIADFSARKNNFSGTFPVWLITSGSLQILDLSQNNFSGSFPWAELAAQPKTKTIYIDNNNFSGSLPDVEWRSERIRWFYIGNNNFEGIIPDSWESIVLDRNGNYIDVSAGNFDLSGNNLSGRLPDWGKNIDINNYGFSNNKFSFSDFGPVYDELKNRFGDGFKVENQKPFGEPLVRSMPIGGELFLNKEEFHYEGNVYQWLKDGNAIAGATGPVLILSAVSAEDEGEYRLEVQNTSMPELGKHLSEPVTFEIGADDGLNDSTRSGSSGDGSTGNEGDSEGSQPIQFPGAPLQHGPDNNLDGAPLSLQFSWTPVEGADYYTLHMSRNSPGGMVIDVAIEDTVYTHPEKLGDSATHHWRVRAVKNGVPGEWSSVFELQTQQANQPAMADIIAPKHFSQNVSVTPRLEWEAVDSDLFKIRIMNKVTSEFVLSDETSGNEYFPDVPLSEETAYIWQVKNTKDGIEGAWSPRWEFTTGVYDYTVGSPFLLSPNQGTEYESLTPTFEWESVDADMYVISVSRENPSNAKVLSGAGSETTVIFEEVPETYYTAEQTLDAETTYFWRVKAIKNGEEGDWSDTWEFITPGNQTVSSDPKELPLQTDLKQNYPNPFNPTTQIEFTLASVQDVSLKVYDMAGRQVAELVNGMMSAGNHEVTFSGDRLASGIYIYRFISGSKIHTKKMTLLK